MSRDKRFWAWLLQQKNKFWEALNSDHEHFALQLKPHYLEASKLMFSFQKTTHKVWNMVKLSNRVEENWLGHVTYFMEAL
jgi:hypothetical protein